MRQCELEQVIFQKGSKNAKRTGVMKVAFIDGVTPDMKGAIIDLKKTDGLWVINEVFEKEVEAHQIKRNWHVGGL